MLIVIAMNGSTAPELSVAFTCTEGEMSWPTGVPDGGVTKVRWPTCTAKPHTLTKPELFDPGLNDHVARPVSVIVEVPAGTTTLGGATQAPVGPPHWGPLPKPRWARLGRPRPLPGTVRRSGHHLSG